MGLMADYGLQLWPILQGEAASRKRAGGAFRCRTGRARRQLKGLYGPKANTFVANAGVLQTFRVNDLETAEWLSRSLGRETIATETRSQHAGDNPSYSVSPMGRELLTPDEVMRLPSHLQLLRLQGRAPIVARKIRYFEEGAFDGLYDPLPVPEGRRA